MHATRSPASPAGVIGGGPLPAPSAASRAAAVPPAVAGPPAARRGWLRNGNAPGDRYAARRAAVLGAEAADVHGEMWGEQTVGLHLVLMACLDSAVPFSGVLATRRDVPPIELRRTARTIGNSLKAAAEAIEVMQNGLLMLAEIRAGRWPRQPPRPRAVRHAATVANGRLQVLEMLRGIAASAAP
jgi:hypothetical protein